MRTKLFSFLLVLSLFAAALPTLAQVGPGADTTPAPEELPVVETPAAPEIATTTEPIPPETATSSEPTDTLPTPEAPLETSAVSEVLADAPAPIGITLEIYTAADTLFDGPLSVAPCVPSDGEANTVNGYCALEQSGLPVTWSWFNFGSPSAFVNTIGGVGNGAGSDNFWLWFEGNDPGFTGLNQHELHEGETLLLTIDRMPTRLTIASTSPAVGEATVATVEGFDAFAFGYQPLPGATLTGISASTTDADGHVTIIATSTTVFSVTAIKDGFLESSIVTLSPVASTTDGGGGGGSGGGGDDSSEFDIPAAFDFLARGQHGGSWDSDLVTDWSAVALSAPDAPSGMRSSLASYLRTHEPSLGSVRDYERHAIALMALNVNPYTGGPRDYITPIADSFDGTQIDDASLVNDDIFALIPLLHAGYRSSDNVIAKMTAFVVGKQHGDGSWEGSPDLTAAAIQALSKVRSLPGVRAAITSAESYLRDRQGSNGGFNDPFATSWILQAIHSLGDSPSDWNVGSSTPLTYLADNQKDDGGMTTSPSDYSTRAWATAYAIPAVEGITWNEALHDFARPTGASGNGTASSTKNATTTVDTEATTTEELAVMEPLIAPYVAVASSTFPLGVTATNGPTNNEVAATETDIPTDNAVVAASGENPEDLAAAAGSSGAWEWLKHLFVSFWSFVTSIF